MEQTIIYIACGMLGVIVHCLIEFKKLKASSVAGNIKFSFGDYLAQDWYSIALSFAAVILWLLFFQQAAEKYPAIKNYTRGTFFVCGYFGSSLIQAFISRAQSKITSIIDTKTTELDQTKAPVTDINSQTIKP